MKKRLITIFLCVVLVVSASGIGVYGKSVSDSKIQEMESRIEVLNREIEDTNDVLDSKDAEILEMTEENKELEAKSAENEAKYMELETKYNELEIKYNDLIAAEEARIAAEEATIAEEEAKKQALTEEYLAVGDLITYGAYEQDNNGENGAEPIEWRILDIQDGKAFVISEKVLDNRRYHTAFNAVTWEESDIRQWLNEIFINAAFTEQEQERIADTNVVDEGNVAYKVEPGNDTVDKLFLLSYHEALVHFACDTDRVAEQTPYAVGKGATAFLDNLWALRTPGRTRGYVMNIEADGDFCGDGMGFFDDGEMVNKNVPVRPAMWIDLY